MSKKKKLTKKSLKNLVAALAVRSIAHEEALNDLEYRLRCQAKVLQRLKGEAE